MDQKKADKYRKEAAEGARAYGLAFSIPAVLAASVGVACAIGFALDKWLGTGPWLTLVFLFLGLGTGARETIRLIKKIDKDTK